MKNNNPVAKWVFTIFIFLVVILLPAGTASAEAAIAHPFDNSVLLMISSQMRLDGEVRSALLPGGRVLALSSQAADGNEIDMLLQLYADQIAKLRASDDYDPDLEARLISQLEDKVDALHRHAQELDTSRSRRRGGLFGLLGRAAKSLGRATGWLMGKAMDGAGDIAEFAIEDVAPQVLKEALQNGAPLNAALVRRVARELLINRVTDAIARDRQKRAERLAEVDTDPAADATWEADFMEAFEDGEDPKEPQDGTDNTDDAESLNLTLQEKAAEGLHTYMITNTQDGETAEPFTRELEYQFTVTGVELYTAGHVYQYTYPKIGPNQYDWGDGYATLTFTDEGVIFQHNDGSYTSVQNRTD